ncbi:MAG: hypothetical protein AB7T49_01200 [Oligoflexales bacterium]
MKLRTLFLVGVFFFACKQESNNEGSSVKAEPVAQAKANICEPGASGNGFAQCMINATKGPNNDYTAASAKCRSQCVKGIEDCKSYFEKAGGNSVTGDHNVQLCCEVVMKTDKTLKTLEECYKAVDPNQLDCEIFPTAPGC